MVRKGETEKLKERRNLKRQEERQRFRKGSKGEKEQR